MTTARGDVDAAVAGLQARWGAAAPRVIGSLALAPVAVPGEPFPEGGGRPVERPVTRADDRVIPTGFASLDAILGPGGLPRSASVAIRGDGSSGRTTLALRLVAEAQVAGSVVAWLDLARTFDPVEAVARGIRLEWLVVITPETLDEGLAIAGSLLAGRSVDLLLLDLPVGRRTTAPGDRPARVAERLGRLAALARRAEALFVVLEPPGLGGPMASAVAGASGLRLELARRSWIRLGRDIVGQRTEVLVARDRYGPPGRRATLRILYAEGGDRDRCLRRDDLLVEAIPTADQAATVDQAPATERTDRHATPAPLPTTPPARAGSGPRLRALPDRAHRPGRSAMGPGDGHRREPRGPRARRPTGHPAGERPSAGTRGELRRARP